MIQIFRPLIRLYWMLGLIVFCIKVPVVLSQVTVESEEVGFRIVELEAADGTNAELSFTAPAYLNAIVHLGVATIVANSSELHDPAANWAVDAFNAANGPHFVEITEVAGSASAPTVGTRRDILQTQVNRVTLSQAWPAGMSGAVKYRIVKHWTIADIFGGLKASGTANSISGTEMVDSAGAWENDDFNGINGPHYIEITSIGASTTHPDVGMRREIVATSSTPKAVQVSEAWPERLVPPLGYRIVKHMAVRSDATGNLRGGSGLTADSFQLWENDTYHTYYYQTEGLGGIGWRRSGDQFTDRSNTPIFPGQGIILSRGEQTALRLFMRGLVKTGITPLAVQPGYNFLANPYASTMTLDSSGLHQGDPSQGVAGGSVITADQVLIWNGVSYDVYYYQNGGLGGIGWRQAGNLTADARNTVIPAAASIILRRMGSSGFTWRIPAHPVK